MVFKRKMVQILMTAAFCNRSLFSCVRCEKLSSAYLHKLPKCDTTNLQRFHKDERRNYAKENFFQAAARKTAADSNRRGRRIYRIQGQLRKEQRQADCRAGGYRHRQHLQIFL